MCCCCVGLRLETAVWSLAICGLGPFYLNFGLFNCVPSLIALHEVEIRRDISRFLVYLWFEWGIEIIGILLHCFLSKLEAHTFQSLLFLLHLLLDTVINAHWIDFCEFWYLFLRSRYCVSGSFYFGCARWVELFLGWFGRWLLCKRLVRCFLGGIFLVW